MFFRTFKKKTGFLVKILIFSIVILFLLLVYIIIKYPIFAIKNIDIEKQNTECIDDLKIKDSSKILGQNFFLIETKKIEENLKLNFFCIKKVFTKKEFPNKIKLTILGREAKVVITSLKDGEATISALLENMATPSAKDFSGSYLADDEGVIFEKANIGMDLPKIFVYRHKINLGDQILQVRDSVKILDKIKSFGIDMKIISILDDFLITETQPKILFNLKGEIDTQLASLQLILNQAKIDSNSLEFIDLRFDKPIVRFAPKKK